MMASIAIAELIYAIMHPLDALSYLQRARKVAELLGCDVPNVKGVMEEESLKGIEKEIMSRLSEYRRFLLGPSSKPHKPQIYYAVVRLLKPAIVVETGVQGGISSAYILQALYKNGGVHYIQ